MTSYDVPWSKVFLFLMEHDEAQVVGRVETFFLPDGEIATKLGNGSFGMRFWAEEVQVEDSEWL